MDGNKLMPFRCPKGRHQRRNQQKNTFCTDNGIKWEKSIHEKYNEGQGAEIMGRIFEYMANPEFPSAPCHNWTNAMMEDTRTGWKLMKVQNELLAKYPTQNIE